MFTGLYNELMLADGGLSKLEREMIAVVVSSINRCFLLLEPLTVPPCDSYRATPILGEQLVMNYRVAGLDERQRAMLDFTALITQSSYTIEEEHRQALRDVWI